MLPKWNSGDFPLSLQKPGRQAPVSNAKSRSQTGAHPAFQPWPDTQLRVCSTCSPSPKELNPTPPSKSTGFFSPVSTLALPGLQPWDLDIDQYPKRPTEIPFRRLTRDR